MFFILHVSCHASIILTICFVYGFTPFGAGKAWYFPLNTPYISRFNGWTWSDECGGIWIILILLALINERLVIVTLKSIKDQYCLACVVQLTQDPFAFIYGKRDALKCAFLLYMILIVSGEYDILVIKNNFRNEHFFYNYLKKWYFQLVSIKYYLH